MGIKIVAIVGVFIGIALIVLATIGRTNKKQFDSKVDKFKNTSGKDIKNKLSNSGSIEKISSFFSNKTETEILFRKAKNPWNLTPNLFNAMRIGSLIIGVVLSVLAHLIGLDFLIITFLFLGGFFFFYPKSHYKKEAERRENQWLFLYQYIWVIKHNLSFFDVKKTFVETEEYIKNDNQRYDELISGFHDFANHWNGEYIDEYLNDTYGDFSIPKELLQIMLTSSITGEFPENELTSLRNTIINKSDFNSKQVLALTGMKATLYSSPMLLLTLGLIVVAPTTMMILQTIG